MDNYEELKDKQKGYDIHGFYEFHNHISEAKNNRDNFEDHLFNALILPLLLSIPFLIIVIVMLCYI